MTKTPGQVAYEAMLPLVRARLDKAAPASAGPLTGDPFLDGAWEAQPQELRDDWEAVAEASRLDLVAEVKRLRDHALDEARAEVAEGCIALQGTCRDLSVELSRLRDQLPVFARLPTFADWAAMYNDVLAERDQLAQELERRNVAHVEPAITAKDRDDWKARAIAAELELDDMRAQLDRAFRGDND